jgi:hypothetical protein
VIAARDLVEVSNDAGDRGMIVVVQIWRETEDRPVAVAKRLQPQRLVASEQFFEDEELVLDEQS